MYTVTGYFDSEVKSGGETIFTKRLRGKNQKTFTTTRYYVSGNEGPCDVQERKASQQLRSSSDWHLDHISANDHVAAIVPAATSALTALSVFEYAFDPALSSLSPLPANATMFCGSLLPVTTSD